MSRITLTPIRHASAHEHQRALHFLADPVHRLGFKLRRCEGFGSDSQERLLVARSSPTGSTTRGHGIELRLPHPDPALSAPRLVLRAQTQSGATTTMTIAYAGHGVWTLELSDEPGPVATFVRLGGTASAWKLIETKRSFGEDALFNLVVQLTGELLAPFGAEESEERRNNLVSTRDLSLYRHFRTLLQIDGVSMRRHASGHSVRGLSGPFLRSPERRNPRLAAVIEVRKAVVRHGQRLPPTLTLHVGRTQADLYSITVGEADGGGWMMASEVWATPGPDLDFVHAMNVESGTRLLTDEGFEAQTSNLLFLYRIVTLEAELEKLARR